LADDHSKASRTSSTVVSRYNLRHGHRSVRDITTADHQYGHPTSVICTSDTPPGSFQYRLQHSMKASCCNMGSTLMCIQCNHTKLHTDNHVMHKMHKCVCLSPLAILLLARTLTTDSVTLDMNNAMFIPSPIITDTPPPSPRQKSHQRYEAQTSTWQGAMHANVSCFGTKSNSHHQHCSPLH
jgi:hypothetical protein